MLTFYTGSEDSNNSNNNKGSTTFAFSIRMDLPNPLDNNNYQTQALKSAIYNEKSDPM